MKTPPRVTGSTTQGTITDRLFGDTTMITFNLMKNGQRIAYLTVSTRHSLSKINDLISDLINLGYGVDDEHY